MYHARIFNLFISEPHTLLHCISLNEITCGFGHKTKLLIFFLIVFQYFSLLLIEQIN